VSTKVLREGQRVDDIVKASGLSRSTVFRYLAGKSVRPAAAASIERAIAVLGSPQRERGPDPARREILVSLPPSYTSFKGYAEALEGILARARETGAAVWIDSRRSESRPPQGVIIVGKTIAEEDEEAEAWEKAGVPCVLVNRILEDEGRSWVAADCRRAAAEAVSHLLGQGCRRVAAWIDEASRVSRDKLRGYRDALKAASIPLDPELVVAPSAMGLDEAFGRLMALPYRPDGWFSPDDETGLRVMALAAARGIAVPGELAVVGMNDIAGAGGLAPALSSVRLPFREMGEASVDAVNRLIERPCERSVRILLRHSLSLRESSVR
jgi:LacI family transcriptional regulator